MFPNEFLRAILVEMYRGVYRSMHGTLESCVPHMERKTPHGYGTNYIHTKPLNYIVKRGKRMTIFIGHVDTFSHNDTNHNPNLTTWIQNTRKVLYIVVLSTKIDNFALKRLGTDVICTKK